jgi:hypothetical protein
MLQSLKQIRYAVAVAATLVSLAFSMPASAIGLLILEGSDAQTFHGLNPYSTDFQNGSAAFSTAPTLPVLAVDLSSHIAGTPTVGVTYLSTIPNLATLLANYSALYIQSPGTCCGENDAAIAGHQADVAAFLAAGRSVTIEDYQGGAAFDSIIGITGAAAGTANSHVAGSGGGVGGLGSCFDGNIVAPGGSAYGLGPVGSAVPSIGCFGHQAYEASFFDAYGLTTYIVATPPGSLTGFHVVISNGGGAGCGLACVVTPTPTPEPASLVMFGTGLAALAMIPGFSNIRRRRQHRDIARS